jgi:hypothetical protein
MVAKEMIVARDIEHICVTYVVWYKAVYSAVQKTVPGAARCEE